MRRALGLMDGPQPSLPASDPPPLPRSAERTITAGKRRFVQDGEVQVVMRKRDGNEPVSAGRPARPQGPSQSRLGECEAKLAEAQSARTRAERALHEAQASLHELRTKLGHAELARQELEAQRAEDAAALAQARAERDAALARLAPLVAAPPIAATPRSLTTDEAPRIRRPVGRPRKERPPEPEQEPVKWWLKSAVRKR